MARKIVRGLVKTYRAAKGWHSDTEPESRTIDNLVSHLRERGHILWSDVMNRLGKEKNADATQPDSDFEERMDFRMLADYFATDGLDYRLTPRTVDALVRPRMYEVQEGGYAFFLKHFHEHPALERMIKEEVGTCMPQIRIIPVCPEGGSLMAWIYNPADMKTYRLKQRGDTYNKGRRSRVISESPYSVLEEYRGRSSPFSAEYKGSVRRFIAGVKLRKAFDRLNYSSPQQ